MHVHVWFTIVVFLYAYWYMVHLGPAGVLGNPAPWAGGCAREHLGPAGVLGNTLGRRVC